jgi:protein SCO1/2
MQKLRGDAGCCVSKRLATAAAICAVLLSLGCSSKAAAKHYALHGIIVDVDRRGQDLIVNADAIPGFMEAMAMPYAVADPAMLDQVQPGDEIRGDLAVDSEHARIVKLELVKHAPPAPSKPAGEMHIPQPGEAVPDLAFTDQSGRRFHLDDFRNKVLLVTFFYTRCPLPDFCPRVNHAFAELDRKLQQNPNLYAATDLLSVSFDPAHDTPKVLRSYGAAYTERYAKEEFRHWQFAVPKQADLKRVADFFGVYIEPGKDQIVHTLSTAVIADGKIFKWYTGNRWTADDLLKDVESAATARAGQAHVPSSQPSS